ncbi:MAG: D-glycerate dehydrogenase [Gemmatimonadetes bacterium]|nr:D-glycerate dehydrogenase [Gemmatimonadota bacterium]MBI3566779.1 D-glycerate dehydrogenase [Gemmatimonadota bacterium]
MSLPIVTVTRRLPRAVEERLALLFEARLSPDDRALGAEGLARALAESDAVVSTLGDPLTADVLGRTPRRARVIAQFGVGYDNIDVAAAAALGITVTNTPGVLTEDTADAAMLLLLAAARRASEGARELREGRWTGWRPTHNLGVRVSGKTLGVIGFGRIGRAVATRARLGFGMTVIAWSRSLSPAQGAKTGVTVVDDLDELLAQSDFVSLHVPSTAETRHLIDARRLSRMRPGAILINTARGDVVDEAALIAALRDGRLAAAGLDVYEREPSIPADLLALPNAVLLPHIGSATIEARTAMGLLAVDNLVAFFEGRPVPNRVA